MARDAYLNAKRPADGSEPKWWNVETNFLRELVAVYEALDGLAEYVEELQNAVEFYRAKADSAINSQHTPEPETRLTKQKALEILAKEDDRVLALYLNPALAEAIYGTKNFENFPDYEQRARYVIHQRYRNYNP